MSARVHLNSVTEKLTQSFKGSLVESHNSSSIGEGKVQDAEWFASLHLFPAAAAAKSLQSCPTLCDPMDSSPPGSPIPGIFQARTLEWVAISFSITSPQGIPKIVEILGFPV